MSTAFKNRAFNGLLFTRNSVLRRPSESIYKFYIQCWIHCAVLIDACSSLLLLPCFWTSWYVLLLVQLVCILISGWISHSLVILFISTISSRVIINLISLSRCKGRPRMTLIIFVKAHKKLETPKNLLGSHIWFKAIQIFVPTI